jgi:hypothetical protein
MSALITSIYRSFCYALLSEIRAVGTSYPLLISISYREA